MYCTVCWNNKNGSFFYACRRTAAAGQAVSDNQNTVGHRTGNREHQKVLLSSTSPRLLLLAVLPVRFASASPLKPDLPFDWRLSFRVRRIYKKMSLKCNRIWYDMRCKDTLSCQLLRDTAVHTHTKCTKYTKYDTWYHTKHQVYLQYQARTICARERAGEQYFNKGRTSKNVLFPSAQVGSQQRTTWRCCCAHKQNVHAFCPQNTAADWTQGHNQKGGFNNQYVVLLARLLFSFPQREGEQQTHTLNSNCNNSTATTATATTAATTTNAAEKKARQ